MAHPESTCWTIIRLSADAKAGALAEGDRRYCEALKKKYPDLVAAEDK